MDASDAVRSYFAKLHALIATFDFTRHGKDESMAKDAAGIVAEGIIDRSAAEQRGIDAAFPANDAEYTRRKVAKYNVDLIGFRTGQMISFPSLLGKLEITPDTVLIIYGTNEPPSGSMSSSYISTSDRAVTDNQKAEWFTEKKGRFFAVDDEIAEKVREYFSDELGRFIRELNAR